MLYLKWSDFQNDRLFYKIGKNEKGGSLKVPQKAMGILQQYKPEDPKHDLVFPDLEKLDDLTDRFNIVRYIKTCARANNNQLEKVAEAAGISKTLTMHIARRCFGNISGDRIPVQMLQKLYLHSSISTTIGYQANFIHKDADDALIGI